MMAAESRSVPASVLIVDDIHTNLIALKAVLSPLGIRVVQAQSGEEALARVREESFAVVLLDVQMPEMDGFEVARRIRALESGNEVPIIFLTAIHRDEVQVKQGYAIGAADYITKPFDVDVLRARVRAFVDLYRQREEVRRAQVALRTRERDEAERRVSAFERITTAALDTHDLSALLHELLSIFLDGGGDADSAAIFLCDGEEHLELATSVTREGESGPTGPARIGEGFAGAILDTRRPLEVTDAEPGPDGFGKSGLARVSYGVPLLSENEVLGVAQIASSRTARFSEREKRLFQAVTERARWAITKHSERSRLRSILREAPALIAIFRGPGQLAELFNPTFQQLVAGDDNLGRSASQLGLAESILAALSHAYASGETVSRNELPLLADHDQKPHFVNVMAQPLSGPTGRIDSTLFFAVDVTEQVWARRQVEAHEAERALLLLREREARTEAEYANRAKDEFLATLSHELRTPMNAVLGWTARAREKAPPELDKALGIVERNAQAQSRLIEDMLDLSRIISGKLRLELSTFMADEPIEGAIEASRPAAEAKGVELRTELAGLGELMADPDRVQQMVWNLLSNAIKFTPKGGMVTVGAERDGPKLVIRVRDSGQGIKPEFLPRVFDRFRQADGSTTRRHGGLGLGLSIVRQLAQAHGGSVYATSEGEGKGAEFVLELPIRSAPTFRHRPTPTRGTEAPITNTHPIVHKLTGVRVLVVDDEPDARSLVSETLSEQGAKVAEADSARRALGLFDEFRPDLVVSDIGMPEMDGYALIRELRARPGELPARVPAIALTAYARSEDVESVLSAGFDLHLAKPVDLKMLLSAVADLARNPPRGP
jgi:signal transduction histidine kinase/DNA-binding response OmpR family regulator